MNLAQRELAIAAIRKYPIIRGSWLDSRGGYCAVGALSAAAGIRSIMSDVNMMLHEVGDYYGLTQNQIWDLVVINDRGGPAVNSLAASFGDRRAGLIEYLLSIPLSELPEQKFEEESKEEELVLA